MSVTKVGEPLQEVRSLSEILFNEKKLEILSFLLDNREEQFTLSEINEYVDASRPTVSKFVKQLSLLGIVERKKKGNLYLINLNERSPYIDSISEILRIDSRPLIKTSKNLAEQIITDGIKSIYLFGSVARGNPKIASDIDILVVTTGDFEEKRKVERKISSKSHELNLNFSPTWYEFEELQQDIEDKIIFAQKIKEEGILLAGEDSL